ncbi:MAG: hypothetical protein AAGA54_25105 [Myxococcota bacterium]
MRRWAMVTLLGVLGCDAGATSGGGRPGEPRMDACELLSAEQVKAQLRAEEPLQTKANALEVVGPLESQCAWQLDGRNRVTLTIMPDVGGRAFQRLKVRADSMSKAGPRLAKSAAVVNTDDVRGNYAVAQSDGALVWNMRDRLFTLNVLDAEGSAADDASRRSLAEAVAAKL